MFNQLESWLDESENHRIIINRIIAGSSLFIGAMFIVSWYLAIIFVIATLSGYELLVELFD